MPTTEDLIRLQKLQQLRNHALAISGAEAGAPQSSMVPEPDQATAAQNPPPRMQAPEEPQAQALPAISERDTPYVVADQLTDQARPKPRPTSILGQLGQAAMQGLASTAYPSYGEYSDTMHARERQRQQDLLGRAKELRAQGFQQQQLGQQNAQFGQRQALDEDQLRLERAKANRPQFRDMGTPGGGVTYGQVDPETARYTEQGNIQGVAAPRNIDPNSQEGIDARLKFERGKPAPAGPKADYEWVKRNGQPMEIVKGTARPGDTPFSPSATSNEASPYSEERAARTVSSVDELLKKVNGMTVGYGSLLSNIPESRARDFRSELETLKSNIMLNELVQMREASKTGGALGQVSDKEGSLLQSALGGLDPGQSIPNFKAQLQKVKDSVTRWQAAKASQGGTRTTGDTKKFPNGKTGVWDGIGWVQQ